MWLSPQKLEMTDFMEEDAKFTLCTRETDIHDLKSKSIKGKYIPYILAYKSQNLPQNLDIIVGGATYDDKRNFISHIQTVTCIGLATNFSNSQLSIV